MENKDLLDFKWICPYCNCYFADSFNMKIPGDLGLVSKKDDIKIRDNYKDKVKINIGVNGLEVFCPGCNKFIFDYIQMIMISKQMLEKKGVFLKHAYNRALEEVKGINKKLEGGK